MIRQIFEWKSEKIKLYSKIVLKFIRKYSLGENTAFLKLLLYEFKTNLHFFSQMFAAPRKYPIQSLAQKKHF